MEGLSPIKQIFELVFPFLERLPVLGAILGFMLVFLLPGFAWTLIFFKRVNVLERMVLSFGLSIALVTLSILALNVLLGIRITGFNALLTIIVLIIVPVVFYYLKRVRRPH